MEGKNIIEVTESKYLENIISKIKKDMDYKPNRRNDTKKE
jgi:hypothetical protein